MRKDGGGHFQAGVVISALRLPDGSIKGFTEVITDLAADQQRAHSMFYDLLEAAPDAMVIIGTDGRITLANAQTDRMFGYQREELIGSEIEMLLPARYRADHRRHRTRFLAAPTLRQMGSGLDLWGACVVTAPSFPSTSA